MILNQSEPRTLSTCRRRYRLWAAGELIICTATRLLGVEGRLVHARCARSAEWSLADHVALPFKMQIGPGSIRGRDETLQWLSGGW